MNQAAMQSPSSQLSSLGSPQANGTPSRSFAVAKPHQRTYQACIPCRKRKVKCDLGPVDDPRPPPCVRCRRENKRCVFSLERRKKKQDSDDDNESEYEIVDGRKRPRLNATLSGASAYAQFADQPLSPGPSYAKPALVNRSTAVEDDDPRTSNRSARILQTGQVYSQADALELLFHAAIDDKEQARLRTTNTNTNTNARSSLSVDNSPVSMPFTSPHNAIVRKVEANGLMSPQGMTSVPQHLPDAAFNTWSRFRFVRAGWFRAEEGMAYVEYFYEHLYPLTPLTTPDYRQRSAQVELLEEEPMLCLTILTIASRFMQLSGAGATSRATIIHQRLNESLEKELGRTIWGQKQFGGGFTGGGAHSIGKADRLCQNYGVIESLMLLTEWHPRSLHFPPDDDDGELLVPENPLQTNTNDGSGPIRLGGTEGRRVDSWLEPCWRSDRMCWMLLSIAEALAWELGVYDDATEDEFRESHPNLNTEKLKSYYCRKNHLKQLLPLYRAQTSGRLELTSNNTKSQLEDIKSMRPEERLKEHIRKAGLDSELANMSQSPTYPELLALLCQKPQDLVIRFWSEATLILDSGNHRLYRNRKLTHQLIESGEYVEKIHEYEPWLTQWFNDFSNCKAIPEQMRHILEIEFQYSRAFLCLLALHAVVERCSRNTPLQRFAELVTRSVGGNASGSSNDATPYTPADVRNYIGSDSPYISECIDACRVIMKVVIDGLLPGGYLKHCPVRTYFRIISAALILLKVANIDPFVQTFMVGASETDLAVTLQLMDKAMEALRTNIVDDVHVGNRFADMVDTLTRRARSRFVRMNAPGNSATSRAETPHIRDTPMIPSNHFTAGPTSNPFNGVQQDNSTMIGTSASGRATPNPALWGISDKIYNPNMNDGMTVMPPPMYFTNGFDQYTHETTNFATMGDGSNDGSYMALGDWLTIPYDGLINANGEVSVTPNGPSIGGSDILDLLYGSAY